MKPQIDQEVGQNCSTCTDWLWPSFRRLCECCYFPHLLPSTTTNNGELIDHLFFWNEVDDSEKLIGRWSLILLKTECGIECDQLGYLATQVVKGLGKDSTRVSKVLLQSDHASSVKQSGDAFYDFQSLKLTNTEALSQISKVAPVFF